ncbi:MAG TPA: HNH endonuclease signature motif containing protein [Mycobacteriales bacterium]|nr:HNH endonuclease signature motif containing protein [Mycobacteriales bacterium]
MFERSDQAATWGVYYDGPSPLSASPEQALLWVLSEPPTAKTLAALELIQPQLTQPHERVLAAVAWERQMSAATARMHAAVSSATTPEPGGMPEELLGVEVGLALRKSSNAADALIAFSHSVVEQTPVMYGLLEQGDVTPQHARVLYSETLDVDLELVRKVDEQISPRAAKLTVPAFRRVVRRAVAALDEINRRAESLRQPDDDRTHGQRQVDAMHDALFGPGGALTPKGGDGAAAPAPRRGRRADVVVTIDFDSLIGWRDLPGEMSGIGPVPAQAVRDLLRREGTTIRRMVYDPIQGVLLDLGKRYPVDGFLRELLDFRDVTCRFPGCTRNAIWCDGEHCEPFPEGETSCANCALMCRRHHRHKTFDGFTYERPAAQTGETVWTTPLGFVYRQQPASYDPTGADTGDVRAVGARRRHAATRASSVRRDGRRGPRARAQS